MEFQDTAERRFLTILHCDLVDSTRLVDSLDPEEFLALMERFLTKAQQIVTHYQGVIAGYTGDGFEAYFGYPVVTELPAADAINAARDISESLKKFNQEAKHRLECRTGVASGHVVIGTAKNLELGRPLFAFGATPHLAERLQSIADIGKVAVDSDTQRLASQYFTFAYTGDRQLKGFETEVSTYEVIAPVNVVSRFNYDSVAQTPIIGRQYVLDVLEERWNAALDGDGQLVFLYGDAGMGKSRSIYEFEKSLKDQSFVTYRFQCSSQHMSTPLHPWLNHLMDLVQFQPDDTSEIKRLKLQKILDEELNLSGELQDFCITLLGVTEDYDEMPIVAAPSNMLSNLQSALIDHVVKKADEVPVLVIVEDEQWIDATSELGLVELVDRSLNVPVLVCVTGRPGSQSITKYPHVTTLSLTRLSRRDVRIMVSAIAVSLNREASPDLVEQIVDKCDGNPLYIEEITSMTLEQQLPDRRAAGNVSLAKNVQIPVTLQASLLARVDRISTGKEIAQLASVIARGFDEALMRDTELFEKQEIRTGLEELVRSNILTLKERDGTRFYDFRHALIRDAIYESLLNDRRKRFHSLIADCYTAQREHNASLRPELIAQHYDLADDWRKAFSLWVTAGERTLRSGATHETVSQLKAALKYEALADEDIAMRPELLRMHMAYGIALNALGGAGADPYRHFHRSTELATLMNDEPQAAIALDWQIGVDFNSGNLLRSKESAEAIFALGEGNHNSISFIAGSQSLGMVNCMLGNFSVAEEIFTNLLEKKSSVVLDVHCYPSMSLSYLAWAQYALGKPDSARKSAMSAIDSAQYESSHSITTALSNCSYVFQSIGDLRRVATCTDQLIKHCDKYGEFMYRIRGEFMQYWLDTLGSTEQSLLVKMHENLSMLVDAKEEIEMTYLYGLMADAELRFGNAKDAKQTLEKAFAIVERNNERFNLGELNSLRSRVEVSYPVGSIS